MKFSGIYARNKDYQYLKVGLNDLTTSACLLSEVSPITKIICNKRSTLSTQWDTCHLSIQFRANSYKWARICQKVSYGCNNQNLANVKSVKYCPLRAFPENLKHLSSILTIVRRLEATYATQFGT